MDISDIELEESNIQKLNSLVDDYLCRRSNFDLSLKIGEGAFVVCKPRKNHWLVTRFQDYAEVKEEWYNSFIEAFNNFKKMCTVALKEEIEKIDSVPRKPLNRIYLLPKKHNKSLIGVFPATSPLRPSKKLK